MSKEKKNNIEKNIECPKRKKKKLKKIEKIAARINPEITCRLFCVTCIALSKPQFH